MSDDVKQERERQVAAFVRNLSQLEDGDRARLKRNGGKPIAESRDAHLLFYRRVLPYGAPAWQEDRYFLLATLYPLDKGQRERDRRRQRGEADDAPAEAGRAVSLGDSFRRARTDLNKEGLDRRFARLLDADGDELPFHLRQAVRRLTNDGTFVDWAQLTRDVLNWDSPRRAVQRHWARDYVAAIGHAAPTAAPDTETEEPETETH